MSVAITQEDGDYAAVVVSGANRDLDAAQVAASADVLRDSRVLLLQNEIDERANVAAAELARGAGTRVILNAAPARPLGAMGGLIDVLVVNTVEAEMLGAGPVGDLDTAAACRAGAADAGTGRHRHRRRCRRGRRHCARSAGRCRPTRSRRLTPMAPAMSSSGPLPLAWPGTLPCPTRCATPTPRPPCTWARPRWSARHLARLRSRPAGGFGGGGSRELKTGSRLVWRGRLSVAP